MCTEGCLENRGFNTIYRPRGPSPAASAHQGCFIVVDLVVDGYTNRIWMAEEAHRITLPLLQDGRVIGLEDPQAQTPLRHDHGTPTHVTVASLRESGNDQDVTGCKGRWTPRTSGSVVMGVKLSRPP